LLIWRCQDRFDRLGDAEAGDVLHAAEVRRTLARDRPERPSLPFFFFGDASMVALSNASILVRLSTRDRAKGGLKPSKARAGMSSTNQDR
jgi:hypothetical protein